MIWGRQQQKPCTTGGERLLTSYYYCGKNDGHVGRLSRAVRHDQLICRGNIQSWTTSAKRVATRFTVVVPCETGGRAASFPGRRRISSSICKAPDGRPRRL